ncbi:MAG TPA: hypothetical protein VF482_21855, partial [Trebonia sp.]
MREEVEEFFASGNDPGELAGILAVRYALAEQEVSFGGSWKGSGRRKRKNAAVLPTGQLGRKPFSSVSTDSIRGTYCRIRVLTHSAGMSYPRPKIEYMTEVLIRDKPALNTGLIPCPSD